MSTPFEIPFASPPESFQITVAGTQYQLTVTWNDAEQCWVLEISDVNDNPILSEIPLVTGANLLEQYDYLGLGFELIVQSDNDPNQVPGFTTLGTTGHLYAVTP